MRHARMLATALGFVFAGSVYVADLTPSSAQQQQPADQLPEGVETRKLEDGRVILTDAKGMTLYTFAKDTENQSNCTEQCAKNWPPLMAPTDAKPMGEWTIITRDDGNRQWAYKGSPLYTWVKDTKPGETSGDGLAGGAWEVAER